MIPKGDPVPPELAQHIAHHVGQATEQMVFRMLREGANVCGVRCPTLNLGVMVGPLALMAMARAYLNSTGLTTGEDIVPTFPTTDPPDPTSQCLN